MDNIFYIIFSFIFTGVIGNFLLHKWQKRQWLFKQSFIGKEKEYQDFKNLIDELVSLVGRRIYSMRKLNDNMLSKEAEFNKAKEEYQEVVKEWNDRLAYFLVRLAPVGFNDELEIRIQELFFSLSKDLDRLSNLREANYKIAIKDLNSIRAGLQTLHNRSLMFNGKLLDKAREEKEEAYNGKETKFSVENIDYFSTWYLFKILFTERQKAKPIRRPPFDS